MAHRTTDLAAMPAHSRKAEWLTPPNIIAALGPFALDPCAAEDQPWPTAARMLTRADDGLSVPWEGMVWCSPPHGARAAPWLEKLARHGTGIAMVFASTDTDAFYDMVWGKATAVFFLEGRLFFHDEMGRRASTNCGAATALVAYGLEAARRLRGSGFKGCYVSGWTVYDGRCAGDPA